MHGKIIFVTFTFTHNYRKKEEKRLVTYTRIHLILFILTEIEYEELPTLFELENYELCLEHPEAVYCVASMELYGDSSNKIYNTMRVSMSKVNFK